MSVMTTTWQTFTAAPHRVMFLGGAVQLVLTMAFWGSELAWRLGHGGSLGGALPAAVLHAYLMLFGLIPFFIFGFLMTTYPRWMDGPEVPRGWVIGAFLPLATGVVVAYATPWLGRYGLAAAVALMMSGFTTGCLALWRVYRVAAAIDKHYERHLNTALTFGIIGQLAFLTWLLGGFDQGFTVMTRVGFWLFLVPVLVTVGHRMIPYFSAGVLADYRAVHPRWSLPLAWVGAAGHALADLADMEAWRWVPDLVLFAVALHLTVRWRLVASLPVRLLAVLHIAFAGLAFSMALFLVQDIAAWFGFRGLLGRAPLHALAIGFVAALAIAMATRVTLGHSGRALQMDRYSWHCFLGIELAMVLRVAAELPGITVMANSVLSLLAALAWLLAAGAWTARYLPLYLRRRSDGKAG